MRVVIVGAGIAGLGAAAGLARGGHEVTVLERRPRVAELGAGIVLWPNALQALEVLGIRDEIRQVAQLSGIGGFRRPDGRWLVRVDGAMFAKRYGQVAAIQRGELLDLLGAAAARGGAQVCTQIHVIGVERDHHGSVVLAGDGRRWDADLVIAADGLRSGVRRRVWPDSPAPRPTGLTAWRWIVDWDTTGLPGDPLSSVTLGAGMEFGIIPLPGRRVYCYASSAHHPDGTVPGPGAYRGWHAPVAALVDAAEPGQMLRHDLFDLPPLGTFVHPDLNLVLIGDAAHAMTPHLGQGAAQGLEDAAHLSHLTQQDHDPAPLLHAYDRARRKRAHAIQKASRHAMSTLAVTHPAAVATRDGVLRALPDHLAWRGLARWTHTDLTDHIHQPHP